MNLSNSQPGLLRSTRILDDPNSPDVIRFLYGKPVPRALLAPVRVEVGTMLSPTSTVLDTLKKRAPSRVPLASPSSHAALPPITKKPMLPLNESLVEIYSIGYSYAHDTGYGNPIGLGILVTSNIVLTPHTVLSDEDLAMKMFAVFPSNVKIVHHFDPKAFFYTNKGLNFTMVGFKVNPAFKRGIVPIEIREEFVLKEWHNVNYIGSGTYPKSVIGIEGHQFSYTGGSHMLKGTPIFTQDWKFQGIHHSSTASYTYNQATRIDCIIEILCSVKNLSTHAELDALLRDYPKAYLGVWRPVKGAFGQGRYMYWVQPLEQQVYRYDILRERWALVNIGNIDQFLIQETPEWSFNRNSQLVYLPDRSFFLLGGTDKNSTRADVYHFISKTKIIYRKAKMLEKREGSTAVYRQNYIYVLGGKYTYNTCEKYSLLNDAWSAIPPMINGRFQPAACLLKSESYLYVAGGCPLEFVGRRIERLNFEYEIWESLPVLLPEPLHMCGTYPVSQDKIAFLGGGSSNQVLMMQVNDMVSDDKGKEEEFLITEVETLDFSIRTTFPAVYFIKNHKVYMLNTEDESDLPKIVNYSYRNFIPNQAKLVANRKKTRLLTSLTDSTIL